jgi:hypothetical protein
VLDDGDLVICRDVVGELLPGEDIDVRDFG